MLKDCPRSALGSLEASFGAAAWRTMIGLRLTPCEEIVCGHLGLQMPAGPLSSSIPPHKKKKRKQFSANINNVIFKAKRLKAGQKPWDTVYTRTSSSGYSQPYRSAS
jgi:hypothetical protein